MRKASVFGTVLVLAVVLAGIYGALHDQVSYTVAPEYFTKFKFRQFGMVRLLLPDRTKASIVGFLASWWMGVPIGLLTGAIGLIHKSHRRRLEVCTLALFVTVGVTAVSGIVGLIYGYVQTRHLDIAEYRLWFVPDDVTELRRFLCAGYMHNAGYIGGVLGIPAAAVFQMVMKKKDAAKGSGAGALGTI